MAQFPNLLNHSLYQLVKKRPLKSLQFSVHQENNPVQLHYLATHADMAQFFMFTCYVLTWENHEAT